jgi:hypothetical protein
MIKNQPIRKNNLLWRPRLLMDRDKMSNLYRGPSMDASYQIHFSKRLQRRRFFRNEPIRKKNCLWRPCLLTDPDEMSNLYRGPSKDAFDSFGSFRGEDCFSQLKSLFEIFTFVSEKNIIYQYLILASLILVACYINSVSRFRTIHLRLINKFKRDFESYFMSVSNFRLDCLLPIYFRFWPTCWEVWKI